MLTENGPLPALDAAEALVVTKYLCSLKRTLDKNFDFYLLNILSLSGGGGSGDSSAPTPTQVRSKAIKVHQKTTKKTPNNS